MIDVIEGAISQCKDVSLLIYKCDSSLIRDCLCGKLRARIIEKSMTHLGRCDTSDFKTDHFTPSNAPPLTSYAPRHSRTNIGNIVTLVRCCPIWKILREGVVDDLLTTYHSR